MNAALEQIEPVLCYAQSEATNENWQRACEALRACVDYAELNRPPTYTEYDPAQLIGRVVSSVGRPVEMSGGHAARHAGDVDQIAALARAFLGNAILEHDAVLRTETTELDGIAVWQVTIDGPGRFPEELQLGFGLSLPLADSESNWTIATRGGRIDARPNQQDLRLKGARAIPDTLNGCESIFVALRDVENRARILAGGEAGVHAAAEADSLRAGLSTILAEFDACDDPLKPCDVRALVRESVSDVPGHDASIPMEICIVPELPPLTIRRNRFTRFLKALPALGRGAMTHGGAIRLEIDFDQPRRSMNFVVVGQGKTDCGTAEIYLPTIARAVDAHGGELDADIQPEGFTLLISVPDAVARSLDDWLPGWDTFAPRSIQMLRLLKSGGPVPPEELILSGVLEDELEHRLLPRLGVAPAATLVHDLIPRAPALAPSSAQRIEKVLSQLKRGKPKKEICAPAYAAEILWMFSVDERHANAVGLAGARSIKIEEFCRLLAATPVDYARALRQLCDVLKPATT